MKPALATSHPKPGNRQPTPVGPLAPSKLIPLRRWFSVAVTGRKRNDCSLTRKYNSGGPDRRGRCGGGKVQILPTSGFRPSRLAEYRCRNTVRARPCRLCLGHLQSRTSLAKGSLVRKAATISRSVASSRVSHSPNQYSYLLRRCLSARSALGPMRAVWPMMPTPTPSPSYWCAAGTLQSLLWI